MKRLRTISEKNSFIRRLLCRLGIHSFKDRIFGDDEVPLPIRGISGYRYEPKYKGMSTGECWRFRECKYCRWGEFKKPLNDIDYEYEES